MVNGFVCSASNVQVFFPVVIFTISFIILYEIVPNYLQTEAFFFLLLLYKILHSEVVNLHLSIWTSTLPYSFGYPKLIPFPRCQSPYHLILICLIFFTSSHHWILLLEIHRPPDYWIGCFILNTFIFFLSETLMSISFKNRLPPQLFLLLIFYEYDYLSIVNFSYFLTILL